MENQPNPGGPTNNVFDPEFWRNFWTDLKVAYYVFRDSRTPMALKLLPAVVLLYILSPADLIPGVIPVLGQLDDVAILILGVKFFLQLAPEEVVREHRSIV
jgi:uncharacterized membrane protein YkvA (DUF1232 family)